MKATVLRGIGDVHGVDVPEPGLVADTDALVRILVAAVCGSDLWSYRGIEKFQPGDRMGHEWIGIVEDVGGRVSRIR